MNIIDYDYKLVNNFILEVHPNKFSREQEWGLSRSIVMLSSASEARHWLSLQHGKDSVKRFGLNKKQSDSYKSARGNLLNRIEEKNPSLADELKADLHRALSGETVEYKHNRTIKPVSDEFYTNTSKDNSKDKQKTNPELNPCYRQRIREVALYRTHRATIDSIYINIITQDNIDPKTAEESAEIFTKQERYEKLVNDFNNHARHINEIDFKQHHYLAKKSKCFVNTSNNFKILGNNLLIKAENTSAIQTIYWDRAGQKQPRVPISCYKKDKAKKGSYAQISAYTIKDGDPIYIAEGISTTLPFVNAGYPTFWAIDAGNLPHATAEIRAKYPNSKIYIAVDNDKSGKGLEFAQKCGTVELLMPTMNDEVKNNKNKKGVDWSDVWVETGDIGFACLLDFAKKNQPEPAKIKERFYTRYLSNSINVKSLASNKTVIRSTQETGKTVLIFEFIKDRLKAGDKVVITTPARALTSSIYTQLETILHDYQVGYYGHFNRSEDNLRVLNLCDVIVTTTQSFTKVNLDFLGDYTLIVDELESVVATFSNNATHKINLLPNRSNFQKALVNSSSFLAVDADITKITRHFVSNAIKEQEATCVVDYCANSYKHKGRVANFYSANDLMMKIINNLHLGKQLIIGTTTKSRAKNMYFSIKQELPHLNMLVVTGEDHDGEEVQELIATRDALKYDVVIYNTAIAVGIDINNHFYDEAYIFADEVFGQTSNTVKQLMQRFRKIKTYNMAISRRVRPEGRDPYYYLNYEIIDSADAEPFIKDITEIRIDDDLKDSGYRETLAEVTAEVHTGLMSEVALIAQYHINECKFWTKNIINTLEIAGFKIITHEEKATEQEIEYLKEFIKAGKEAKKQNIEDTFKQREHLGYSERKANKDDSMEVFKQCRKTDILVSLKDITEDLRSKVLYKLIKNNKVFSEIASNISIISKSDFRFRDYCHEKRFKDPTFYLSNKGFISTKRKELNLIADFFGFDPIAKKLKSIKTWSTKHNSKEMLELLGSLYIESENPVTIINKLAFKKLGLVVGSKQVRIPKAELTAEQIASGKTFKYREFFIEDTSVYKNICDYVLNTPEDKDKLKNIIDFVEEERQKVIRYHINKTLDPPNNALIA
jgi:hypothetical protein